MDNVIGFRDLNNRQNNRGNQRNQNFNMPSQLQSIPFMNSGRTHLSALQETFPHTLRIYCCPDIKFFSITVILLFLLWLIYICCLSQKIDYNDTVLSVDPEVILAAGAVERDKITKDKEIYRLLTAAFLHWNLLHITLNSFYVLFFLSRLQVLYPYYYTLALMICSAITGNLTTAVVNKDTISAGSSTMLFGVLGAYIGYLIINWSYLEAYGAIRSQLFCTILFMVIISLFFSFGKHTDYSAHLGGLMGGILTFIGLFPSLGQKNQIFTYIGLGGLLGYNFIFFAVLLMF